MSNIHYDKITSGTFFVFLMVLFSLPSVCYAQGSSEYSYSEEAPVKNLLPKSLSPRQNNGEAGSSSVQFPPLTTEDLYASPFRKSKPRVYRIDDHTEYVYHKPGVFEFLVNAPADILQFTVNSFRSENLPTLGLVLSSTAVLVYYDQAILESTQRFGRNIGLKGSNNQKTYFTIAGQPLQFPHDTDTALYFIGDGWVHVSFAAGFLFFGLVKDDNRALQTASQLAEGMVTCGLTTQFLKHITGRESPFVSTRSGGRWVFLPDQIEYHKHVPNFDAYPSGHLATGIMTVTVIAENYSEKKWIRPVGYTLLTLLAFEMVNNGVHWISDYPLAIAMGYSLGRIAVSRGRMERRLSPGYSGREKWLNSLRFFPTVDTRGFYGMRLAYTF